MPTQNWSEHQINDNSFSKGEKQLLAFARAIAKETSIYVFDEPTSNVDVENEIQLKKVIDNLPKDATVIIIAHRLNTISHCNRFYEVGEQKVTEKTREEVLGNGK